MYCSLFGEICEYSVVVGRHDTAHHSQTLAHVSAFAAAAAGRMETVAKAGVIVCRSTTLVHNNTLLLLLRRLRLDYDYDYGVSESTGMGRVKMVLCRDTWR